MKSARIGWLLILCVPLSVAFAGYGGGGREKASVPTNSQAQPPSAEKTGHENAEPPNKTAMNIVDMGKQIVITEEQISSKNVKSGPPGYFWGFAFYTFQC